MKVAPHLERVQIPTEFVNKTAFLFEVKDSSFLHLGIASGSIVLVDNSKELSTRYPVVFVKENETYLGLPENIAEDLYYLENKVIVEKSLLFSVNEISLIGQVRGVYRQNKSQTGLLFEKL